MRAFVFTLCAAMLGCASESPFVGTWKLNPEKSELTGTTLAYEQLPAGEMRVTVSGQSFTFRMDGVEYPTPFGTTVSWKRVDSTTWQVTHKMKAQLLSTDTMKVSGGGTVLNVVSRGQQPDGTTFEDHVAYERVAGGPGLAGTWKSTKVSVGVPETVEFAALEGDGLAWTIPGIKGSLNLRFDGKEYHPEGPTLPPDLTLAATRTGPRSFALVQSMGGKVLFRGTMTVSDDGKTLTSVGTPEGTSEKTTAVYERQ